MLFVSKVSKCPVDIQKTIDHQSPLQALKLLDTWSTKAWPDSVLLVLGKAVGTLKVLDVQLGMDDHVIFTSGYTCIQFVCVYLSIYLSNYLFIFIYIFIYIYIYLYIYICTLLFYLYIYICTLLFYIYIYICLDTHIIRLNIKYIDKCIYIYAWEGHFKLNCLIFDLLVKHG